MNTLLKALLQTLVIGLLLPMALMSYQKGHTEMVVGNLMVIAFNALFLVSNIVQLKEVLKEKSNA